MAAEKKPTPPHRRTDVRTKSPRPAAASPRPAPAPSRPAAAPSRPAAASVGPAVSSRSAAAPARPAAEVVRPATVLVRPTGDHLSIEEKYDEVRQLINIGKEKGYLLYDEVNELLPSEITSSDELDDLFNTFGSAGIEVIDSDQKYLRDDAKPIDRTGEGAEELELDLTPGALDKTNDPVRMYLREMGTVPLLTREGEVE